MNDNKMITQSRIIEEYGWTKSLISKFLPDPVLKANPHYRKAAPMRLWDEDTVKQVMTTSEFQDAVEKANKRKKSASKAVETKYSNMNHSVQLFIDSITIKVLSDEELKTKALKAKQEWYQCHPCSLNGDWIDEPYNVFNYDIILMKTKLLGLLRFRRTLINDSKFNQTAKELSLDSTEKSNLATIWTFLRKRMGLSASQAAGVCGNLSFESHFSTDNLQDDISRIDHDPNYKYNSSDRKGYGLMQWSEKIEKTKLLQTANNMNLNVSDLNAQLAHFQEEMTSGIYRNKWPKLKQKTSTKDVCDYFESAIEGAGEAHLDKREKDANILYKYLKNH